MQNLRKRTNSFNFAEKPKWEAGLSITAESRSPDLREHFRYNTFTTFKQICRLNFIPTSPGLFHKKIDKNIEALLVGGLFRMIIQTVELLRR